MAEHQVNRLVVVDAEGRLAGIVSRGDVLRVFLRPDEEIREAVLREIVPYAIWADPHEIDVTVSDGVVDNLRYEYEHAPPTVPSDLDI
jgi:CBS domain-containing protein